jgi:hypothetical protein
MLRIRRYLSARLDINLIYAEESHAPQAFEVSPNGMLLPELTALREKSPSITALLFNSLCNPLIDIYSPKKGRTHRL